MYKVLWQDFPREIATWEDADSIPNDFIHEYEHRISQATEEESDEEGGETDKS